MEKDQAFVEMIVKAIVNHPDDVRTERTIDERGVLITLHINQEDMGYVIGRSGQTARSIRTLLKIVGAKENARVNLKIYEPEGSRPPRKEYRESEVSNESSNVEASEPAPAVSNDDDIDTSFVDNLSI
ncbi:RNA-binding protein [Candidatus Uhrbacteria bacterium CG_4_10_14_0_2_um_filter_41_7]|uniref:RNA-binding protein KhpA n=1 Tax=Candidatus Uhrbacteria bacterium CG_4_9_14_3_um_filter_41_35 TaxID=1975034 RepID=A0A2M7XGU8_9BACT|nr:MAG: RNA-binding protein [Candidatus Uhrbacteria bacterium CG11_big_fil_rev_8_21_14_0_20_41_9]PIZ53612.1 MAG: RNA-binding protein [Candidatus Uhrbacteria bacterium CG_4_10_14_0_2_um_filter_41_7]PJA47075.1 MAG: RNA-binding protein [Candidatus Uhrbacteria bacterium CG_4_9_14_3_um_filter_41_35]